MSLTVMSVVLLAALLHASWNFLVKRADDKFLSMSAMVIGHAPFALLVLCFSPWPAQEAWIWMVLSATLHAGYQLFLLNAYRFGDLSQVYPLARGMGPLLVTVVSVTLLGADLQGLELLAIGLIITGIVTLGHLPRTPDERRAVWLALATGVFIAGYSLSDGMGARLSGTAFGYYSTLALLNAVCWSLYMQRVRPGLLRRLLRTDWKLLLAAGGASYTAYVLVIWAFTRAPLPLVTALRETSMIFALLLGVLVLKERMTYWKLLSAGLTLLGVLLLRAGSLLT
ncbi:MAG: DMT family transporter [Thiolinea sp.]